MIDIFYDEIIKEASNGTVNADIPYNILFNTVIPEADINIKQNINYDNVFVPTLTIKNKKLFDELLTTYLNLSLDFYSDDNFYTDTLDKISNNIKIKTILALLWSNATIEDFQNPINYLRKRISFYKNNLTEYKDWTDLGYSNILNSNIYLRVSKSKLRNEAPYKVEIYLTMDNELYELPNIYYGISNQELYIYAIQNKEHINNISGKYQKFIKRKLYSVNEGIDLSNETFENYGVGNLIDITPSFLLALNIFMGVISNKDINKIIVPTILMLRWNDKQVMYDKKSRVIDTFDKSNELERYEYIQSNLTEKLIRTFLRLGSHSDGIEVLNIPFESDSSLIMSLDKINNFNNSLLEETFRLSRNKFESKERDQSL